MKCLKGYLQKWRQEHPSYHSGWIKVHPDRCAEYRKTYYRKWKKKVKGEWE